MLGYNVQKERHLLMTMIRRLCCRATLELLFLCQHQLILIGQVHVSRLYLPHLLLQKIHHFYILTN